LNFFDGRWSHGSGREAERLGKITGAYGTRFRESVAKPGTLFQIKLGKNKIIIMDFVSN
jgi:hypothetical protein